ncbi:hypothetical protein [Embleya sp. NPDC005575]|uniref:hypothetical protein n=1 Tax=Embleya sp. NPDC005575 TaxID=3156892 RepID=UPI0033BDFA85
MQSLYEEIAKVVSGAVAKAAETRSETPKRPVRVWDGMQAVWVVYESDPIGRVEASLTLRPDDVRMLGKEDLAREFRVTVGSRAWLDDEHQPIWSSSDRYSRTIEQEVFEDELAKWIVGTVSAALERASRGLRPSSMVGQSVSAPSSDAPDRLVRAPSSAIPRKKEMVTAEKTLAKAAAKKTSSGKKAAPAKKTTEKKPAAKRTTGKMAAPAKKSPAKKTTAKKTSAEDAAAKRTTGKRAAPAKKGLVKKTTEKKTSAKKTPSAKKTTAKKATARQR